MSSAEKFNTDLMEAMSSGVDQMTAGTDPIPQPEESGVVRVSEKPDADDNRMLTRSLIPKAAGDIRKKLISLATLAGLTEGDQSEE